MKKITTLIVALVALATSAAAQSYNMVVTTTQGEEVYFNTDYVASVSLADHPDENIGWTSCGRCLYGEDFMASAFYISDPGDIVCEYYVEVQESEEQESLYRLVAPYSPENYPISASTLSYDATQIHYLEIDASDPEGVFIPLQDTGLSWGSEGRIYVYSYAAYYLDRGYDLTTIKQAGWCGTIRRGVITFPTDALLFYAPEYSSTSYYVANSHGAFKVDLTATDAASAPRGRVVTAPFTLDDLVPISEDEIKRAIERVKR